MFDTYGDRLAVSVQLEVVPLDTALRDGDEVAFLPPVSGGAGDCWIANRPLLEADAVDVLQADATRALGITGFLQANALCAARSLPLSAHCAPAIHAHAGAAASQYPTEASTPRSTMRRQPAIHDLLDHIGELRCRSGKTNAASLPPVPERVTRIS